MKQKLALAATCAAALASIATSQMVPSWEVSATTDGPALSLTTSGSISHGIAISMNTAGMAGGANRGQVVVEASACLEGAAAGDVTLLLTVLDTNGDGRAMQSVVPACPSTVALEADTTVWLDCESNVACTEHANATFARDGAPGGNVTVQWSATTTIGGYGGDNPPDGAQASIVVE